MIIRANYEIFVLAMVIYQFINSILYFLLEGDQQQIILIISLVISAFLLVDAFIRFNRQGYNRHWWTEFHGYLIFLGSLPIPFIVSARLVWYWLVTGRMQSGDFAQAYQVVIKKNAQTALLAAILAAMIVLEFGSMAVYNAELASPDRNIQTGGDALWWSIVTIATVGYGDRYPVTPNGRIVGVFMMIVGVGLFSVLTSYLAHGFLRPRREAQDAQTPAFASLDQIKALLDAHEKSNQELMAGLQKRLDALEEALSDRDRPAG